jgi:xanthine dehydrogenase accessory factor
MVNAWDSLWDRLAREPAILVTVQQLQGSGPREEGAWMAVFPEAVIGTIGGGHLEYQAVNWAREQLAVQPLPMLPEGGRQQRLALGPSLGQCCGGVVHLQYELVQAAQAPALRQRLAPRCWPLALFGGGHVGHALVQALAPLPWAVRWIDSRDEIFPRDCPPGVHCEHADPVQSAVADLVGGSRVLIMSFSHAEDLDVVAACLRRQREQGDLPWLGLIGSRTKWASFRHRLMARGFTEAELAQVACPIGIAGITSKVPAVIAVSVAAQLMQLIESA